MMVNGGLWHLVLLLLPLASSVKIRNQQPVTFTQTSIERDLSTAPNCNLATNRQFPATVLLEFLGFPDLITSQEVTLIVDTVRNTYNNLIYCTAPHFRRIDQVQLVTPLGGFAALGERFFSLEVNLQGTCRGCNQTTTLFSYGESICPCSGPSIRSFQVALDESIYRLVATRQLRNIRWLESAAELETLPQCPQWVDFSTSDVVVQFWGCPADITETHLDIMAADFMDTYNNLNGLNTRFCDRFFREIVSLEAALDDDYNVNFGRKLERDLFPVEHQVLHRRRLSKDGYEYECPFYFDVLFDIKARCRGCDPDTITLFDEEQEVNNFSGFDEDEDDDDGDGNYYSRRLRGTKSMDPFADYDDEDYAYSTLNNRQVYQAAHDVRELQQTGCLCPQKAQYRAVTEEEMIFAYNITLAINKDLPQLSVEDVIEVQEVDCDPVVSDFQSTLEVSLGTDSTDGAVTDELLKMFARYFQVSYNDLSNRYCDPLFRSVTNVSVEAQSVEPVRRDLQVASRPVTLDLSFLSFLGTRISTQSRPPATTGTVAVPTFSFKFVVNLVFFIRGTCRACNGKGTLLNEAARRMLFNNYNETTTIISPTALLKERKYRKMQTSTGKCLCSAVNVVDGAPTEREFSGRFAADLQELSLSGTLTNRFSVSSLNEKITDPSVVTQVRSPECTVQTTAVDCVAKQRGSLCVNNECLHEGNPRITLTWTGDDDLDLSVFTPSGTEIWYDNDFDWATNGVFDTSFTQDVFGSHVESIYFPLSGTAPAGSYRIIVASFTQVNTADNWKIEVFTTAGGATPVLVQEGQGTSDMIFEFGDGVPQVACLLADPFVQCCRDQDCPSSGPFQRQCVNRLCITKGSPRITLSYFGNDDLSLIVLTPDQREIMIHKMYDPDSGGTFEADPNALAMTETWHTQNVFFPPDAPYGEYIYFVKSNKQVGVKDSWQLVANDDDFPAPLVNSGSGDSTNNFYDLVECSSDSDCFEREVCVQNYCCPISEPRFTLTWEGQDDLDLYVILPSGRKLNWENDGDSATTANFLGDLYPMGGKYLEYVYFEVDAKAPTGTYRFGVESYFQLGSADTWNITVDLGRKNEKTYKGTGIQEFTWTYTRSTRHALCFSGETTVITEDRGVILMKELEVGDKVATTASSYEPVYSFGHRHARFEASYIRIMPSELEISADHMIFMKGGHAVPASSLRVGDRLLNGDEITSIGSITRQGMYAPFTPSGTLLVNNVTVSSYVAFQDSEYLRIGSFRTPWTYQWLAHTFQVPHRLWCSFLVDQCRGESSSQTGVSTWVELPLQLTQWWLSSNVFVMSIVLIPIIVGMMTFFCVEYILTMQPVFQTALVSLVVGYYIILSRRDKATDSQRRWNC